MLSGNDPYLVAETAVALASLHETALWKLQSEHRGGTVRTGLIRILERNGPSGGSLSDVAVKNTLILSDDPVAADARATALFGLRPEEMGFIRLAKKWGLGTDDLAQLDQKKVTI